MHMRAHLPYCLAIALAACLAPSARADRPAVEAALAEMSRAAAAADAQAYLSHVSPADPIFFKEQSNWAKDLSRKPPASVKFTIAKPREDDTAPEFGETKATFEMVTTWTMPTEDGGETRVREVSFPVTFVLENGKWVYAGEDWLVLEGGKTSPTAEKPEIAPSEGAKEPATSDSKADAKKEEPEAARPRDARFQGAAKAGFDPTATHNPIERMARVKYFPGYEEVAKRIVQVLPEVRDHVDEGFGERIARVQEVKIYPSMKHLQESIYLSYVDGLAGWNEPGEAIKILTRPNTTARSLRGLLAHEYGHVATFELGPKANDMAWWILEGVAELSAERFVGAGSGKNVEALVIGWQNTRKLAAWDDLADFHKVQDSSERDLQGKVYKQGQHMMMFISDTFGRDARNTWLREMSQGKTIDEASVAAFKMPFAELDAKWRDAVVALAAKAAVEKAEKAAKEAQESDAAKDAPPKPKG
jgi:hypothetical protein